MPTVRQYDQRVGVRPLDPPTERAAVADMGGLGTGLQKLGSSIAGIAEDQLQEQARTEADHLDLEFTKAVNEASRGEGGFLNQQGMNAIDYEKPIANLEKVRQSIAKKASSEFARRVFDAKSAGRLESARAAFDQHSYQQREVMADEDFKEARRITYEAAADATSPEQVQAELVKLLVDPPIEGEEGDAAPGIARRRFMKMGVKDMDTAERRLLAEGYRAAIVHKIKTQDVQAASSMFEAFKGKLDKEVADDIEKALHKLNIRTKANTVAVQIAELSRDSVEGWVDEEKAIKSFNSLNIQDAELRTEADKLLGEIIKNGKQEREAKIDTVWRRVLGAWNETARRTGGSGYSGINPEDERWLDKNAPDLMKRLIDKDYSIRKGQRAEYRAIKSAERAEQNFMFNSAAQKSTDRTHRNLFNSMSPELMVSADPVRLYGGIVSDEGMSAIMRDQERMRRLVANKDSVHLNNFVSMIMAAGQGIAKSKTDKAELGAQAREAFFQVYEREKRPPTLKEAMAIRDDLLRLSAAQAAKSPLTRAITPTEFNYEALAEDRQRNAREGVPAASPTFNPSTGRVEKNRYVEDDGTVIVEYADGTFEEIKP